MDITVTSTSKTFYQVDATLAAILLEAFPGAFERTRGPQYREPVPFVKPEPKWAVIRNPFSGRYAVQMTIGARTEVCDGTAELAEASFKRMGFPCPDAILAEYKQALKQPTEEQQSARDRRAFEQSWDGNSNKAIGKRPELLG